MLSLCNAIKITPCLIQKNGAKEFQIVTNPSYKWLKSIKWEHMMQFYMVKNGTLPSTSADKEDHGVKMKPKNSKGVGNQPVHTEIKTKVWCVRLSTTPKALKLLQRMFKPAVSLPHFKH